MTDKQKKAIETISELLHNGMDKEQYMIVLEAILEERVSTQYYPWLVDTRPLDTRPWITYGNTADPNVVRQSITTADLKIE